MKQSQTSVIMFMAQASCTRLCGPLVLTGFAHGLAVAELGWSLLRCLG